jgi:hypothetical protein
MEKSISPPPTASFSSTPNLKIRSVDQLYQFCIGLEYNIAMLTDESAIENLNDLLKGIGETES